MISVILATDKNSLIGKNNLLPWHYKEDLAFFKKVTLNKIVVMGRKTFESILTTNKKPLSERTNVVCSKEEYSYPGVIVINDLFRYLEENKEKDIFIIGGKSIYEITLPICDYLYVTHINKEHEGDQYLHIDYKKFKLLERQESGILTFAKYQRI